MKVFLAALSILLAVSAVPVSAIETSPGSFNSLSTPGAPPGQSFIGSFQGEATQFWNNRGQLVFDEVTPVPEPREWAMIAAGIGVVGFAARRHRLRATQP